MRWEPEHNRERARARAVKSRGTKVLSSCRRRHCRHCCRCVWCAHSALCSFLPVALRGIAKLRIVNVRSSHLWKSGLLCNTHCHITARICSVRASLFLKRRVIFYLRKSAKESHRGIHITFYTHHYHVCKNWYKVFPDLDTSFLVIFYSNARPKLRFISHYKCFEAFVFSFLSVKKKNASKHRGIK